MQELLAHYDVTPEVAWRKQVARSNIKKDFYDNETNFTFDKYVTKLKGIFNVLDKYCVMIYKAQMV